MAFYKVVSCHAIICCSPGRLDSCVYVGLPDEAERAELLAALLARMPVSFATSISAHAPLLPSDRPNTTTPPMGLDAIAAASSQSQLVAAIAAATPSFSGADLANLARKAATAAIQVSPSIWYLLLYSNSPLSL